MGIRIWIPLRDSSGVSPDSMTLSWLVGGRVVHRPMRDKMKLGGGWWIGKFAQRMHGHADAALAA
jgi:hypothetical protein